MVFALLSAASMDCFVQLNILASSGSVKSGFISIARSSALRSIFLLRVSLYFGFKEFVFSSNFRHLYTFDGNILNASYSSFPL